MDDTRIIELYFQRSEEAIAQTEKKYGRYCYSIAYNILKDELDSMECVNDTYLKVWEKIPPAKPSPFSTFIGRIFPLTVFAQKALKREFPIPPCLRSLTKLSAITKQTFTIPSF